MLKSLPSGPVTPTVGGLVCPFEVRVLPGDPFMCSALSMGTEESMVLMLRNGMIRCLPLPVFTTFPEHLQVFETKWNLDTHLTFPEQSAIALKLWASVFPGFNNVFQLLLHAMQYNILFQFAYDLPKLVDEEERRVWNQGLSSMPALSQLEGSYLEQGYVEDNLKFGKGGMDFVTNWKGKLQDVLCRSHAKAVVGEGNVIAWIIYTWTEWSMWEWFMKEGPSDVLSTQMLVKRQSQVQGV